MSPLLTRSLLTTLRERTDVFAVNRWVIKGATGSNCDRDRMQERFIYFFRLSMRWKCNKVFFKYWQSSSITAHRSSSRRLIDYPLIKWLIFTARQIKRSSRWRWETDDEAIRFFFFFKENKFWTRIEVKKRREGRWHTNHKKSKQKRDSSSTPQKGSSSEQRSLVFVTRSNQEPVDWLLWFDSLFFSFVYENPRSLFLFFVQFLVKFHAD